MPIDSEGRDTAAKPLGWRMVPVEPTEAMMEAMTGPFMAVNGDNRKAFGSAYAAMLSAAPLPAAPAADRGTLRESTGTNFRGMEYVTREWVPDAPAADRAVSELPTPLPPPDAPSSALPPSSRSSAMAESTHPADLSKSAPGIDTTQPAGALPEPFGYVMEWPAMGGGSELVFSRTDAAGKAIGCVIRPMFVDYMMRALMAERDAARVEVAALKAQNARDAEGLEWATEGAKQIIAERDALRRELEELRAQKPAGWFLHDPNYHGWQQVAKEHEASIGTQPLYARPIPSDAREGREPLTEAAIMSDVGPRWSARHSDWRHFFISGVRYAEKHHGIGPAGTSADGETQP